MINFGRLKVFSYYSTITWFLRGIDEDSAIDLIRKRNIVDKWGYNVEGMAWMWEAWVPCPQ